MENKSDPHLQATLEARYGIHYNAANERLFRRLKFAFEFGSLFAGSAAFAGAVASVPALAASAGVVLAALAVVNLLVSPGEAALRHNEAYRRFTDLNARTGALTTEQLRAEIERIRAGAPWGVDSLAATSYNRCLLANGYEHGHMEVGRWQRFVAFFA